MPDRIVNQLNTLEKLAAYTGPWQAFHHASKNLAPRLEELQHRADTEDDVLVIALVGGTGVGKSTLLNALAGDTLARTSEYRPCTEKPTVYHPPGVTLDFMDWDTVSGSALEHLVIVDTPDSDTIAKTHRERVIEVLGKCDLILLCGSAEKYLDEATWSLLRPLQGERSMICIETKAQGESSPIEAHWVGRLEEENFTVSAFFRVNALRSLDRKLAARASTPEELDFPKLESFLRDELSAERIRRIKRSNFSGLMNKTIQALETCVTESEPRLAALAEQLDMVDKALTREILTVIERRLFTESHLWTYALGREMGLRAKGFVGMLYRILESIRTLPARLSGWLPWRRSGSGAGRQAAALLTHNELFQDDLELANDEMALLYQTRQSEIGLAFAQAGFDRPDSAAGLDAFRQSINERVTAVLRGPARDVVVLRARRLTGWPMTLLSDALPLAFLGYASYDVVQDWFQGMALPVGYVSHTCLVLALLLGVELAVLMGIARITAWSARGAALRKLKTALSGTLHLFKYEQDILQASLEIRDSVKSLKTP